MTRHSICHVEWISTDFEKSKAYFGELFQWEFYPMGEDYLMFSAGDYHSTGGAFVKVPAGTPTQRLPRAYVLVDDVPQSLDKAISLGGTLVEPVMEVPGYGVMAAFADPDGNQVGLWKAFENQ